MTEAVYTKHFKDLDFTVVATPYSHWVEYAIYDIEGYTSIDNMPLWHKADSEEYPDCVESLSEAEVYISGSVKWDGCSNWNIDENERGMLHGCSRQDIQRIGDIMAQCWDWTSQLIPNKWSGE